ncbi:MAG: hypothetical protein DI598_16460, partial [Pseudopedobacter saltans]
MAETIKRGNRFSKITKWKLWLAIAVVLSIASFVISHYFAYNANSSRVKSVLEHSLAKKENVFYNLIGDKDKVSQLTVKSGLADNTTNLEIEKLPIGIFVYKLNDIGNPLLVFWNNSHEDVNESILKKDDGAYPLSNNKGLFEQINHTLKVGTSTYKIVGLIPIYWQYPQSSNLLKSQFDGYPKLGQRYKISGTGVPIVNKTGQVAYYIEKTDSDSFAKLDTISLVLKVISLLIALALLNNYIRRFAIRYGFYKGLSLFLTIVLGARLLSYYFAFPFDFRVYELFDPLIYATTWLHRSLGDLVVNLFLLWWITSFIKINFPLVKRAPLTRKLWRYKYVIAIVALVFLTVATIEFVRLVESLVTDSQISFNVTNFFAMDKYTVVCFVALGIFMWCYVRLCYLCLWPARLVSISYFQRIIIIAATGVIVGALFSNADTILSDFLTTIWVIVFSVIYDKSWNGFRKDFVASPIFL